MSLTAGQRLGSYEVLSAIGAGGMGEVYRARDTKLNRDVAIKVLPDLFAKDRDRLARFTREAQTLAALNHPNIAQIYGIEGAALVMELVEGDDLSVIIARGPIPLADALPIAKQIAEALEAAHELGIVHRDLKPANIKVRDDGTVKVLDFGLAKALAPAGSSASADAMNSPTLTAHATQMGMIIGTAAYMAPEQARGKSVDKRADVWAFGVVLYEMLSGRRAFEGEDISITLANVLKEDVRWDALPANLSESVRRLLRRCLEKDPRKRLSSIGDARLELDEIAPAATTIETRAAFAGRSISLALAAGIVLIAILASAGATRWLLPATSGVGGVPHLSIALPEGDVVVSTNLMPLALSPDGGALAYAGVRDGKKQIYVRRIADPKPVALAGTEDGASPFFSPDGQWIGFFAQGSLKRIAVGGAALQVLCDAGQPRGGSWGSDGNIYFAPTNFSGIWTVPASGGAVTELTRPDHAKGEISHRWPQVLPGSESLLFSIWTGPGVDERAIVVQSIATKERHVLLRGADTARYLAAGYLLYAREDALFAVPWRPSAHEIGGAAPLTLPAHPRGGEGEGATNYAVSENGTLVYLPGGAERYLTRLAWVDRTGNTQVIPVPERNYTSVDVSSDGRQAIVAVTAGTISLWKLDLSRYTLTPFATAGGSSQVGLWTPDGKRVVYRGTRTGIRNLFWKAADGTGEEERLTTKENVIHSPSSISSDGRWLVFSEAGIATRGDIWMLRLDDDHAPQPLLRTPAYESAPKVSPDGRWLAYQSDVSGRQEIYVQPFPGPGPQRPISRDGGVEPLWSRDGRELFYQNGDNMMAVAVAASPDFSASAPRVLFTGRYRASTTTMTGYSISADGRRFLRIQQVQAEQAVNRIDVVLNWFAQLKQIAAAK